MVLTIFRLGKCSTCLRLKQQVQQAHSDAEQAEYRAQLDKHCLLQQKGQLT